MGWESVWREELGCCGAFLLLDLGSKLDPGPLCSGQEKWEKGKGRGLWGCTEPQEKVGQGTVWDSHAILFLSTIRMVF